jgi:hypothetical protein
LATISTWPFIGSFTGTFNVLGQAGTFTGTFNVEFTLISYQMC